VDPLKEVFTLIELEDAVRVNGEVKFIALDTLLYEAHIPQIWLWAGSIQLVASLAPNQLELTLIVGIWVGLVETCVDLILKLKLFGVNDASDLRVRI
jgi:hypothetical protein